MRYIIVLFVLLILVSCKKQLDKELNRPFIKSSKELNANCVKLFKTILSPYEFGNDSIVISKVYKLDVNLDASIYSKSDLLYNYFIGIKLLPDSFDIVIFNINLEIGALALCQILPGERLIIKNSVYLFTDLTSLCNCGGMNIPDSLLKYTSNSKTIFRSIAWTTDMYGAWQLDTINKNIFVDDRFNNIWIFKRENKFLLLGDSNDTLITDSIDLQGDVLTLVNTNHFFEIATLTKKKILLKENNTDEFKLLKRIHNKE